MKNLKKVLILLFVGIVSFNYAQDMNAAGEAFNNGNQALKGKDFAGAVTYYEESLDECSMIGADAAELQGKVEGQLTKAYYYNAQVLYKKKKFDASVAEFNKAIEAAGVSGDTKTEGKAKKFIPKVNTSKGMGLVKEKKYDEAIALFDEAKNSKSASVKAYYGMGLAYKGKSDIDAAAESFDNCIKSGEGNPKAEKTTTKAKLTAQKMLEANAAKELQIEHTQKAVDYLTKATSYGTGSANTYYMLALAYNNQKKFDDAITAATKALTIEGVDGNSVNFELGKAYEGKGDATNACASYKKVTGGPNVKAAEFQIKEVLKCK